MDQLGWLADSLDDSVATVATLMLGTRFLASAGREGLWHERVVRSYRDQWKAKHAETVERLSRADVALASYEAEDVRTWLQQVPRGAPVCSFPPFYGSGYEKLYEPLNAHFTWDAPEYAPLSDADVVGVLGAITDRPYWLTASNHDVPELHQYLRGVIKATPRAAPFYVYASEAPTRIVAPRQPIEPVKAPRLRAGEQLVGPLRLSMLKPSQFNAPRSRYLNPRVAPGAANLAVAVKDGTGKILGVFAMSPSSYTTRRYGWVATYDAVLTALMICAHIWYGDGRGLTDVFGVWNTWDSRVHHLIPFDREKQDYIAYSTSKLFAVVYPEVVTLAPLIASPYPSFSGTANPDT